MREAAAIARARQSHITPSMGPTTLHHFVLVGKSARGTGEIMLCVVKKTENGVVTKETDIGESQSGTDRTRLRLLFLTYSG